MIPIGPYHPAADPQRPGAWTQAEIDAWNTAAKCDHAAFRTADSPFRPLEECPDCHAVLRSRTDQQGWVDHHAELRAEERALKDAFLEDREAAR